MYAIRIYNNARYQDESEAYTIEGFANYVHALGKARNIVRQSLLELYKPGMNAASLYKVYTTFGEDPVIVPGPANMPRFSAWDYAKILSAEICGSPPS